MKSLSLVACLAAGSIASVAISAPVAEGGQKFSMVLTDEAEVPGPGDPNASGTANIIINPGQSRVCWEITTSGVNPSYVIAAGVGAHIHEGGPTVAGPIRVHLGLTLNGTNSGCTSVPRTLLETIRKNPGNFYVNVHWRHPTDPTQNFSAGALRAQLTKNQLL